MRLVTPVLPTALCKSSRIRHSPNSGTVCRFPVLPTPCAKTAKSCAFCDSLPVFYGGILQGFVKLDCLYSQLRKCFVLICSTFATASRCLHSLRSVDMTVLASKYSCLVQTPCAKTPEFGEAEFWGSMPVYCFAAFATLVC